MQRFKWNFSGSLLMAFVLIASLFIYSCRKDRLIEDITNTPGEKVSTLVSGQVVDEQNNALTGVKIIAGGKITFTNERGLFTIEDIQTPKDRCYVRAEMDGYFTASRTPFPVKDGTTLVKLVMMSNASAVPVSAASGGTVSLSNGAKVELPAACVVSANGNAYTGTVYVSVRHLDPDDPNFGNLIPGNMDAIREDHSFVTLQSYGVLNIELRDGNGNLLQLAPGKEATLTVPLPQSKASAAPASIPLWYFDEAKGYWIEEGVAGKQGDVYVGNVKHFTPWNCDQPYPPHYLKGHVVECNLLPLPGVVVTIDGYYKVITDADGAFYAKVAANQSALIEIRKEDNFGLLWSDSKMVTAGNPNDTTDVGTFQVVCPSRVVGTLVDCDGLPVAGNIYISWDDGSNYTHTTTGAFSIPVAPNKNAVFYAYGSNGKQVTRSIVTAASPMAMNMDTVEVCDTVITGPNGPNQFYMNGPDFTNQLVLIDTSETWYNQSPAACTIQFYTQAINGEVFNVICHLKGNMPGGYSQSEIKSFDISSFSNQSHNYMAKNVTVLLYQVPDQGGRLTGEFFGEFEDFLGGPMFVQEGKFDYIPAH